MLDRKSGYPHCLLIEDCLFTLFMSLNEIRRLMLPTPDLRPVTSSLIIFCVFGRGFGRLGSTAPAVKVRSDKNESRCAANFCRACSKSVSLSPPWVPLICIALIVVLLLLLSVPLCSGEKVSEDIDKRASSERLERRWYEFRLGFLGVVGGPSFSASAAASSSIVCSTGAGGVFSIGSSSLPHRSCELSTPEKVSALYFYMHDLRIRTTNIEPISERSRRCLSGRDWSHRAGSRRFSSRKMK